MEELGKITLDTTRDLANHAIQYGRPWALQSCAFSVSSSAPSTTQREVTLRIFNAPRHGPITETVRTSLTLSVTAG